MARLIEERDGKASVEVDGPFNAAARRGGANYRGARRGAGSPFGGSSSPKGDPGPPFFFSRGAGSPSRGSRRGAGSPKGDPVPQKGIQEGSQLPARGSWIPKRGTGSPGELDPLSAPLLPLKLPRLHARAVPDLLASTHKHLSLALM